jgi:hypothetical protein
VMSITEPDGSLLHHADNIWELSYEEPFRTFHER